MPDAVKIAVHFDGLIYALQPHGGISRNFTSLIRALSDRGDVDLTLYLPNRMHVPEELLHVNTQYLPSGPRLRPARIMAGINSWIVDRRKSAFWSALKTGIFHSTYYSSPVGLSIPQVLTLHDTIVEDYPGLFNSPRDISHRTAKLRAFGASSAIVVPSQHAGLRVAANYPIGARKIVVIPHALDDNFRTVPSESEIASFKQRLPQRRPFLLHVGSRYAHKNVGNLLKAFAAWEDSRQFDLVLAGGGPLTESESRLIDALGIGERIVLLPSLKDRELLAAYHTATAFVFPSLVEGFGFPVLEALACACPTACSNAASLPEVGGESPVYFDPQDNESIRAALGDVVTSGLERSRWELARRRAQVRNWKHVAGEYVNVYKSLLPS